MHYQCEYPHIIFCGGGRQLNQFVPFSVFCLKPVKLLAIVEDRNGQN